MSRYEVHVYETLVYRHIVPVEAENEAQAVDKVQDMVEEGRISLFGPRDGKLTEVEPIFEYEVPTYGRR